MEPDLVQCDSILTLRKLEQQVYSTIRQRKPATVRELVGILQRDAPGDSLDVGAIAHAVKRLRDEGKIKLKTPIISSPSFRTYLSDLSLSYSFWIVSTLVLGTIVAIFLLPENLPWLVVRWILGSVFVLFLPGYGLVEVLFPREGQLDQIEIFVLSVALSLGLIPVVGILLDYTPWGIRMSPVVVALSLLAAGLSTGGTYRRYKLRSEPELPRAEARRV